MRETIIKRILNIVGITALTILFFACDDALQVSEQQDKATVSFTVIGSTMRTVLPQISLDDVASYKLLGGIIGEDETALDEFTTGETSISLDPGIWNFTLNAYNNSEEHILQGKVQNKQINVTATNQVAFSLSVLNGGTGTIQVTLNFPESAGISQISTSGDIVSENFTPTSSGSFVYTKSRVATGDHFINFELYCGDVLRSVVSELVLVRNNLTSSKTITLVGEDLKPLLTGTISITGTALVGETLTADTGALDGTGTISYQWKRSDSATTVGTNITTNATSETYTLVDADEGKYITVTVTRNGFVGDVTGDPTAAVTAPIPVTLDSVIANGSEIETTTHLTLTFDEAITDLTADDITLSGVSGVTKGTLSGSGPVYTLPISGQANDGTLNVSVSKLGYTISGLPQTVDIFAVPVTFISVTANGSEMQVTTTLTLTFGAVLTGLTADDITLSGISGVNKGILSGSGPTYTLPISGQAGDGLLNVSVSKLGYTISGSSRTVYIYAIPVTFSSLTANGSSTQTTTQLTLTFSQAITGLTAADITLSDVTGANNITKSLNGSGPTYTLTVGTITAGGTLSVTVTKAGYTISSSRTVTIYYAIPVTFTNLTANGSSTQTTTQLTLTFSQAITGLTSADIALSGISSIQKGTLSGSGLTYYLTISGFTNGGNVTVSVSKSGYSISGSSKTVTVYGALASPTITIQNNTSQSVSYYWVKPSTATSWGSYSYLNLSSGQSQAITLPSSTNRVYDIRISNSSSASSGGSYYTFIKYGVTVSDGMTVTFTSSDLNGGSITLPQITIQNRSGVYFDYCYIKPSSSSDWGESFGSLSNNSDKTVTIPIPSTNYIVFDILMRRSGTTVTHTKYNVTISNGTTVTILSTDSNSTITELPVMVIQNNTSQSVSYYWVKPSTATSWGSYSYFSNAISSGNSQAITLPQHLSVNRVYDIRISNSSSASTTSGYYTFVKYGVTVSDGMTVTFTTNDLNGGSITLPQITIQNRSGVYFDYCYIKPSSSSDWGESFGSLSNNSDKTVTIPIPPANYTRFDIQMRRSGTTVTHTKYNVLISNETTVTILSTDSNSTITELPVIVIQNNTSQSVSYYWVKPSTSTDWGSYSYFSNTISSGNSQTITLPQHLSVNRVYDIRISNSSSASTTSGYYTFIRNSVTVSDGMTVTFTNSNLQQ